MVWVRVLRGDPIYMEGEPDRRYRHGLENRWFSGMGMDFEYARLPPDSTAARYMGINPTVSIALEAKTKLQSA